MEKIVSRRKGKAMEKLCLVDKCLEAAVTGSKNDMFQFTQG